MKRFSGALLLLAHSIVSIDADYGEKAQTGSLTIYESYQSKINDLHDQVLTNTKNLKSLKNNPHYPQILQSKYNEFTELLKDTGIDIGEDYLAANLNQPEMLSLYYQLSPIKTMVDKDFKSKQ